MTLALFERILAVLRPTPNPTSGWVHDPSRRLRLDLDAKALCGVGLGAPFDELFRVAPYTGEVRVSGEPVDGGWISREADVVRAFGEPTRRDEDEEETVLFYELGSIERQLELTPEGRIKTIAIFSVP